MNVNGSKGASLLEVLMSIGLFALTISALMGVYQQSAQAGVRAETAYTAYNLAKNHVERLRTLTYSLLPNASEISTVIDKNGNPDPEGSYIRSTTVTANYGSNPLLTKVVVQVYFHVKGKQSGAPMKISTLILNQ